MEFAEGRRSIVHRDVGCHNMLGKDGRLAALLDWETAVVGNPAQDLGYAYHTIVQMMPWEEFLAEYEKAGGIIPRPAEIDYYRLWRAVWIMGFQLLARSYFLSGLTTEMILAYASQYWYQRSEHTLHEMVDMVYRRYGVIAAPA
jgi:aminoglycoside phosphotransferase (APT) family kinase protein